MSILDGNFSGDATRKNNQQNNRNGKQNNRNNQQNNRKGNGTRAPYGAGSDYKFTNSSYLPEESREDVEVTETPVERRTDSRAETVFKFCEDFTENVTNYKALQELMADDFPDVIKIMSGYYNTRTAPELVDAMNKMVNVAATTQFATTLGSMLESGIWTEDLIYDKIWRDIAFLLSVTLETSHARMHDTAIRKYVTDILPKMWKPEINEITRQTGITKDLALDLIIAIPMIGSEWNGSNIDAFYPRFLSKMLEHADNNMDVLNHEVQGMLYERFFGKSKTALKVIGKFLVSEPRKKTGEEVPDAVYDEFVKMLYEKLDNYDIGDIAYVFNFVSKYRKEHENAKVIFDAVIASKYENVKKGLLQVMEEDPETMKTLA